MDATLEKIAFTRAITCLALELPEPVYNDISTNIMAYVGMLEKKLDLLREALDNRNLVENKAHALFTEPLSTGLTFAHTPGQCSPLGFVQVMRHALEEMSKALMMLDPNNPALRNPHIFIPNE